MTNKKEKFPRCPYCGGEMTLENNEDVLFGIFMDEEKMYWYQCNAPSCGIHSPACHTKAGAYKAAMKRYEAPNRVLTLEEVREIAIGNGTYTDGDVCWFEQKKWKGGEWASIHDRLVYEYPDETRETFDWLVIGSEDFESIEASEYGKTWRCWLRHPTKQERAETPWEEESNNAD